MARFGSLAFVILLVAATIGVGSLLYAIFDAGQQTLEDQSEWENVSAYESPEVGEAAVEGQGYQRQLFTYAPVIIVLGTGVSVLIAGRR